MAKHNRFTGNYRRIVWVCFTILRDQLLKLRQILLLKKQNKTKINSLCLAESFGNFGDFCALMSLSYDTLF